MRALRKVRERYEGKPITTRELLHVFEEDLPRPLWYEGHKSLDWFYEGWVNGTAIPHLKSAGSNMRTQLAPLPSLEPSCKKTRLMIW